MRLIVISIPFLFLNSDEIPDRYPYNNTEVLEFMIDHECLDDILEFERDIADTIHGESYN